ncbi:MAG TPA: cobyrinate a,c-diamide synthase [Nitrospirae bacterium]|nr:cobyrinate a,c-diamide synthase [Nitrospirota bacterium]
MKAIMIAGTHSGCGKTTVTLALLSALTHMGLKVQAFKAGPDFIDKGLHQIATGTTSRNLDMVMCGRDYVCHSFLKHSSKADISVIEGVMGLYDGDYSTYKLAEILKVPIILVVDATGIAESIGAVVKGYLQYDTQGLIKGIIFNKVSSQRHYDRINKAKFDVGILGHLTKDSLIKIPKRHLGLTVFEEKPLHNEALQRLIDNTMKNIDVNQIITLSSTDLNESSFYDQRHKLFNKLPQNPIIALAYDKAFCFYYEDNLDYFRDIKGEIIRFSPLSDSNLPKADMLYLGGGYPELYAKALSENKSMIDSVKEWVHSAMPLYAECGGMMYLSQGIFDLDNNYHKMVGIYNFQTKMIHKISRLGYRFVDVKEDCVLCDKAVTVAGHEFHYSEIVGNYPLRNIYDVKDIDNKPVDTGGYLFKNTLASYVHIHFYSQSIK